MTLQRSPQWPEGQARGSPCPSWQAAHSHLPPSAAHAAARGRLGTPASTACSPPGFLPACSHGSLQLWPVLICKTVLRSGGGGGEETGASPRPLVEKAVVEKWQLSSSEGRELATQTPTPCPALWLPHREWLIASGSPSAHAHQGGGAPGPPGPLARVAGLRT